jgi:hypothetical protein
MIEIRNFTDALEHAQAFIHAKCAHLEDADLSIHIKHTRARRRDVTGYYRLNDHRIVLAVKRRLRFPRTAAYGVATRPVRRPVSARRPYRLVWHEERFSSPDELVVFVAGHEFWHFLCHVGRRKRNHETKANCHGFLWLREFQCWNGPAEPVAAFPEIPPRPDLEAAPAAPDLGFQLPLFARL